MRIPIVSSALRYLKTFGADKKALNEELLKLLSEQETVSIKEVRDFLERGADVNAQDIYGISLLHYAVSRKEEDLVEFLIDMGANVNIERNDGSNPLIIAVKPDNNKIAKLLIDKGINPNTKNLFGYTPLQRAAIYGDKELIELLIAAGADVNAKDILGTSCLMGAKDKEITELLKKHGAVE